MQNLAYDMRISDLSSGVCSSDLRARRLAGLAVGGQAVEAPGHARPPRLDRPVHQVRRRDARPAVRVRAAEGGAGLGLGGRQLSQTDRKSVVSGTWVSVRVDFGGGRLFEKNKKNNYKIK